MIFTRRRFEKVRAWAPGVGGLAARDYVSPPYIVQQPHVLNGWQARLDPAPGDEWWMDRKGRWHQTRWVEQAARLIAEAKRGAIVFPSLLPLPIRAALVMAFGIAPLWLSDPAVSLAALLGFMSERQYPPFLGGVGAQTTDTTQLLDAAMSFGVSGDAFALGFVAPSKTVESALFFTTAVGATNSMSCRLRTRASGLPANPATQETTAVAFSGTGWNEIASFNTALTYGTQYYMSLEDGAASTADVTVQIGNNRLDQSSSNFSLLWLNLGSWWRTITTNGWAAQTAAFQCTGVVTFSDGTALGNPISASATQNVAQKGLKWVGGPTEDLDVYGVVESDLFVASAFTTGQIFSGTNGPSGASADDSTKTLLVGNSATNILGWLTNAFPYRMTGGTDYRVTHFDNAAFTTGARKYSIGTVNSGTAADLKYCLPAGGGWIWTNESGGAWSDDDAGFPGLALLLQDQVAIAAGGGGIRLAGHGGLAG